MREGENYQDLRQKIHLYFDNELDCTDCEDLLEQINKDPDCQNLFNREKKFRDFVKSNIRRPSVSSSLISNIKSSINIEE